MSEITGSKMQQALEFAYEKATTTGLPGLGSAIDMAEACREKYPGDLIAQADELIKRQIAKSAASGFVTGLGGFVTLPVAIPANLASVLYIQIKMAAAIAHLSGHDVRDDRIKTLVFASILGDRVKDVLKESGIDVAAEFVIGKMISGFTVDTALRVTRVVGYRLAAQLGVKGPGKLVPLLGGVIGGVIDAVWTKAVGSAAKKIFIGGRVPEDKIRPELTHDKDPA